MAKKVNNKWSGESPEEQLKIEKTRFDNKIKRSKKNVVNPKTRKAVGSNSILTLETSGLGKFPRGSP